MERAGSPRARGETVVLSLATTAYERETIDDWAARTHPGMRVVQGPDGAGELDESVELMPARVVWQPAKHEGERHGILVDIVTLTNPRAPRASAQRRLGTQHPDRVQVVAGEPASVGELRERYVHQVSSDLAFTDFVELQATLAADRAERRLIGDRYKAPKRVAEQIASSLRFRKRVADLAEGLGRTESSVLDEAAEKLNTIVATQSQLVSDLFNATFKNLHERAWTVSVDLDTLDRLKRISKESSLVFLPSHRSYADPLVLSSVLRGHDIAPPHVLGGNNLSFWPMGAIGRRSGVIFIRRKIGDDPIYKLAMRSYLSYLVEKRFNLEWYIEGGRSRSGKLRPPMLGLLSYVVDAVDQLDDADVMVVPTSIVYDQLAEVGLMAKEAGGGKKKAEGVGWLLKYARQQQHHRGAARVRFGEPFSLKAALAEAGEGQARLEKVAFRVMDGINRATPISATSLAGFALLGAGERAFTGTEIERILRPLLDYIRRRGLPGPDPALLRGEGLRETLGELERAGVLRMYDGGSEPVWSISPGNHAVAAYYRNGALHYLVNRAIVELLLLHGARSHGASPARMLAAAMDEAMRLRDLLKFEFFFPPKQQFRDELQDEMELLAPGWLKRPQPPEASEQVLRQNAGALVARRTLQPFLDAQLVIAECLRAHGEDPVDTAPFIEECLGMGHQMALQARIRTRDSVSRELYTAAVKLADNRDLVEATKPQLAARRRRFHTEIEGVRTRLAQIAAFEDEALDEVTAGQGKGR